MLRGIYNGKIDWLWGKGALLQQDPNNKDNYIAQFNDLKLNESHGWHTFKKTSFRSVAPISKDD